MQAVLDVPMRTDPFAEPLRGLGGAQQKKAVSVVVLSAISRTRTTLPTAVRPGQSWSCLQPCNVGRDHAGPGLDATMVAVNRAIADRQRGLRVVQEGPHVVAKRPLVAPGLRRALFNAKA